jgi:hypothetical protein
MAAAISVEARLGPMIDEKVRIKAHRPARVASRKAHRDLEVHLCPGASQPVREPQGRSAERHVHRLQDIDFAHRADDPVVVAGQAPPPPKHSGG